MDDYILTKSDKIVYSLTMVAPSWLFGTLGYLAYYGFNNESIEAHQNNPKYDALTVTRTPQ